jgi:CrcB protein
VVRELAAVFVGGALGALARTGVSEAWPVGAGQWPWATFAANVAGCLALGAVLVLTAPGTARRGLLGPGVCGGLTTFSTLQLELVDLLRAGEGVLAAAYAATSVVVGLAAVEAGRRLAGGAPAARGLTEAPEE